MKVSEVTAFLENAYNVLNEEYFNGELLPVVITIQSSKANGHYTCWDAWSEKGNGYREINLGAERLSRSVFAILGTLIHEMVHHYCAMKGIKDTSRGGTYHNSNFKREAEARGLIIDYDIRIGHSITTPSPELIGFIKEQGWQDIDLFRNSEAELLVGGSGTSGTTGTSGTIGTGRKKSNVRKYICPYPNCKCSVRATKEVQIACMLHDSPVMMVIEEK